MRRGPWILLALAGAVTLGSGLFLLHLWRAAAQPATLTWGSPGLFPKDLFEQAREELVVYSCAFLSHGIAAVTAALLALWLMARALPVEGRRVPKILAYALIVLAVGSGPPARVELGRWMFFVQNGKSPEDFQRWVLTVGTNLGRDKPILPKEGALDDLLGDRVSYEPIVLPPVKQGPPCRLGFWFWAHVVGLPLMMLAAAASRPILLSQRRRG